MHKTSPDKQIKIIEFLTDRPKYKKKQVPNSMMQHRHISETMSFFFAMMMMMMMMGQSAITSATMRRLLGWLLLHNAFGHVRFATDKSRKHK